MKKRNQIQISIWDDPLYLALRKWRMRQVNIKVTDFNELKSDLVADIVIQGIKDDIH